MLQGGNKREVRTMSVKVIAMLARRPDLTEREFVTYYETRHAPLILAIAPQIRDYRRNYLHRDGAILAAGARQPDFDVVTELWFDDQAAFDAAMQALTDPVNAARIARDEENVFDRSRTMFFVATERGCGQHGSEAQESAAPRS
jgi:uncharacterized protein (TIGR02118 family)